jgi:putative membrane protein
MAQQATNPATAAAAKQSKTVEQHSRKIARSAKEIESTSHNIESSADRTTRLAADRTILAAERTYAAWVRTGLFALASGIGARALLTGILPEWLIQADASMLILCSVFCYTAAVWRYLNPGPPPPRPSVRQIPRVALVVTNLFLAVVSVAALVGIWMR